MHSDKSGTTIKQSSGELLMLPPDIRSVQKTVSGIYTLRSTGESIENPDFLSTWIVEK